MICRDCKVDKAIEDFKFYHGHTYRMSTCSECHNTKLNSRNLNRSIDKNNNKMKYARNVLIDILDGIDTRNKEKYRQGIEKARLCVKTLGNLGGTYE
jgi:hypothetical protein